MHTIVVKTSKDGKEGKDGKDARESSNDVEMVAQGGEATKEEGDNKKKKVISSFN